MGKRKLTPKQQAVPLWKREALSGWGWKPLPTPLRVRRLKGGR